MTAAERHNLSVVGEDSNDTDHDPISPREVRTLANRVGECVDRIWNSFHRWIKVGAVLASVAAIATFAINIYQAYAVAEQNRLLRHDLVRTEYEATRNEIYQESKTRTEMSPQLTRRVARLLEDAGAVAPHKYSLERGGIARATFDSQLKVDFRIFKFHYADLHGRPLVVQLPTGNVRPMLVGLQLRGANLYQATLSGLDLTESVFDDANIEEAFLNGADVNYVSFRNANLRNADLRVLLNLDTADLTGADLTGARVESADWIDSQRLACPRGLNPDDWKVIELPIDGSTNGVWYSLKRR